MPAPVDIYNPLIKPMFDRVEDIYPEVITDLFRSAGLLTRGKVTRLSINPATEENIGHSDTLFHMTITYEKPDQECPPEKVFLKFGKSSKEYFFYSQIAAAFSGKFVPYCFFAGYTPATDRTCLLLEALSASYTQTEWPLPPSLEMCVQTAQQLAGIHAMWWENPRLENEFCLVFPPGRSWKDRLTKAYQDLDAFIDFLDDRLSITRANMYRRILHSQHIWETHPGEPSQTLLHGDMHFWNVMYPIQGKSKQPHKEIVFFDWNMWDIGRPTDDLAYMLA